MVQNKLGLKLYAGAAFSRDPHVWSTPCRGLKPLLLTIFIQNWVESCASGDKIKTGIYLIVNRKHLRHFPQYDAKFNAWACAEGCDSASDCYYAGLKNRSDGRLSDLSYFYYINMSESYYNLKLLKDRIKVIDGSRYDCPS